MLSVLAKQVFVPPAVVAELSAGRQLGLSLPDPVALEWVTVQAPASLAPLPLAANLGPGEREVLVLGLENLDAVLVLDDAFARRIAEGVGLRFTGTLGILLDAKRAGLITNVSPLLEALTAHVFRLSHATHTAVLRLAEELSDFSE